MALGLEFTGRAEDLNIYVNPEYEIGYGVERLGRHMEALRIAVAVAMDENIEARRPMIEEEVTTRIRGQSKPQCQWRRR